MAMVFYKFIKMLEYEVANPGQDEESEKDAAAAAMSPARAKKETMLRKSPKETDRGWDRPGNWTALCSRARVLAAR